MSCLSGERNISSVSLVNVLLVTRTAAGSQRVSHGMMNATATIPLAIRSVSVVVQLVRQF